MPLLVRDDELVGVEAPPLGVEPTPGNFRWPGCRFVIAYREASGKSSVFALFRLVEEFSTEQQLAAMTSPGIELPRRFDQHGGGFFFGNYTCEQWVVPTGVRAIWFMTTTALGEDDLSFDRWFLDYDGRLTPEEALALAKAEEYRRRRTIDRAFSTSLLGNDPREVTRQEIPDDVKIFLWQRDRGVCVRCGSNNNLEFDHVIPVVMGGSNTARNLQLLCESCNRAKGGHLI